MIGVEEITRVIPHRPPMLLIERVSELVPGRQLTAHKLVSGRELTLGGSTPGLEPALLVESWAQAALVLLLWEAPNPDVLAGQVAVAVAVERVAFGRPVVVGDEVAHRVMFVRRYGDMTIVRGSATVGDEVVLEIGRFVAALRPAATLRG